MAPSSDLPPQVPAGLDEDIPSDGREPEEPPRPRFCKRCGGAMSMGICANCEPEPAPPRRIRRGRAR